MIKIDIKKTGKEIKAKKTKNEMDEKNKEKHQREGKDEGNEKKRHEGGKKCLQKGERERGNEKKEERRTGCRMRAETEGSARKVKKGKERYNTHTRAHTLHTTPLSHTNTQQAAYRCGHPYA